MAAIRWRDMHDGSLGGVLRLIREGRALTRTDVMDLTGLSRSTVMQRLGVLLERGCWSSSPRPARRAGAWPAALTFNERVGVVLAADLGAEHGRLRHDLAGVVLAEGKAPIADRRRPGRGAGLGRATLRRAAGGSRARAGRTCWRRRSACPVPSRTGRPRQAADHAGLGRLPGRGAVVRALRRAGAGRARRQRDGARGAPAPLAGDREPRVREGRDRDRRRDHHRR